MNLDIIIQLVVSGLTIGCIYSLVGLGFSLTLRATELINFAHGEMVMLGALTGYTLLTVFGLPYITVFILSTVIVAVVGVLLERIVLRPMFVRRAPLLNLLIATLGMSIALQAIAIIIWGREPLPYPPVFDRDIMIAGIRFQPLNLWILGLSIVLMLALHLFLKKTLVGISWRAASLDPNTAALYGVDRRTNVALTFGISAGLGGAAGVLIAPLFFASYQLGFSVLIKAFAAAALGGFGIIGTMVGGIVIGIVETLAAGLVSSNYKNVILYGLLIFVLIAVFRPRGAIGRSSSEGSKAVAGSDIKNLMKRIPRAYKLALMFVAVAVWLALPWVSDAYLLRLMILATISAIAALGLQVIVGYTGQFSFGHAAFYGIGAYASALLTLKLGLPFIISLPLSALIAGLASLAIVPVLRLHGHFLAIATLAAGEIVFLLMNNLTWLTNGAYGIYGIKSPTIWSLDIDTDPKYFILSTLLLALLYFVIKRIIFSRTGRALIAVRENELAASCYGINPLRQKTIAFMLGAICAGVAGSLYAHYVAYLNPNFFGFITSVDMVVMVVIGGLGSLPGAIIGTIAVVLLPEVLRIFEEYRLVIYGGLIILFMMYLPGGLADIGRRLARLPLFR
jgi:branched-chain amino acid transport system permease protein